MNRLLHLFIHLLKENCLVYWLNLCRTGATQWTTTDGMRTSTKNGTHANIFLIPSEENRGQ